VKEMEKHYNDPAALRMHLSYMSRCVSELEDKLEEANTVRTTNMCNDSVTCVNLTVQMLNWNRGLAAPIPKCLPLVS